MKELNDLGFSDNQILVYLKLLEFGKMSVWDISIKSGIKRTTCYDIIKSLINLNLISKILENNKSFYVAVDPQYLINFVREKEENIKSIIPKLKRLENTKNFKKNLVEVYSGVVGIKFMLDKILEFENKILYCFGSSRLCEKVLSFYSDNFNEVRINKNIELKAIIEPKSKLKFENLNSSFKNITIKYNSSMKFQEIVYFMISNKVFMVKLISSRIEIIFIDDSYIFNSQLLLFNNIWINSN